MYTPEYVGNLTVCIRIQLLVVQVQIGKNCILEKLNNIIIIIQYDYILIKLNCYEKEPFEIRIQIASQLYAYLVELHRNVLYKKILLVIAFIICIYNIV